jgi:nitrogen-specific signal transduction histidine kinase/class 3 adenylate cyclase
LQDSLEPGHHLDRGLKTIQESSVFFLNILNLPTIIKKMSSDECFRFMNSFFGTIHPVIQSFGGSLQRFSHDGLLAFFPLHKGQYSNNSIHAALSIQDTVTIYNRGRRRANYTAVEVDIGIATGPAAMGICGSELRFQEGAFGSTLLEATEAMKSCRALDENVVITKSTFQMLDQPETFNTRSVMDRSGILLPLHSVTAYSLKDTRPIQADPMNLMGEKQMRRMLEKNCGIVTAISHDIKNTLTSIKGIFDCLKDDSVPNMDIEELIDVGQSKLHLTGDYLQSLLNFVKKDRPKLNDEEDSNVRSSDLKKILQTVVHSHSFDATNAELKLKVEIPDEPFHFRIPRMDFIMAVSNLIGNAIKFTPPKGKITISIRKTSHLNRKQKVELTVKDNGRGIPKEHLSEIEKPYTQVYDEDAQLGMGLGLNNVRNVAQKHGGKLKVQSSLGKGSSFTVELHLEESGGPFERSTISPLRILLVDDDPVSLRVTQLALKNQGHNVTTCRNIPKALISYRTDDFDIIITDFDIRPEGNAFDLITVLNPQIPVICYSGEDEMPKNSLSKGIHGFIRKPASIELIQGAMQEAIQRQLHHQT